MANYEEIRRLIDRVRARWRALCAYHAFVRAALGVVAALGAMLVAARWISASPILLAVITLAALVASAAVLAWALLPLGRRPSDAQIARFIEEREPDLDDRLVTAVERQSKTATAFDRLLIADAANRARQVEPERIVAAESLRRAAFQAGAAALALIALLLLGRDPLRESVDAMALTLFPARVTLDVAPGNAHVKAGSRVDVRARLVGNRAPVIAQFQVADGDSWRVSDMTAGKDGFALSLPSVSSSFKYRIVAGTVTSPTYDVTVVHPPRVTRIDVDYTYPQGLGLQQRTERDGGDVYAPAGTDVTLHIFTDRPAANGVLALGDGKQLALNLTQPTELTTSLKVVDDNSYRVALADREGIGSGGDTEYFIRTLEDRPPEVRITKPAQDRQVTKLEEVDIDAQAEDDYGIARLDLVYVVGDKEQSVQLSIPKNEASVKAHHTLFLEDLDVQPGDFIAYYVRARDLTRGTRPNEARSDIFFLEVKPFEQEFTLAASQAAAGAGGRSSIDDLVTAQKEVIVSTFKLDRRAQMSKGARSEADIHAVSQAESELKDRVEQTSSTFRESTMRDPRKRPQGRGQPPSPDAPKAGQTLAEEDDMAAAALAMAKAVDALDALKTQPALQPEMEALNHLLKAQADVKKREVNRQQAGSGAGNNRSNYDVSALFDKELKKQQQTNYETKSSAEQKDDPNKSALDKLKDLASRQDELLKQQQALAKNREKMSEDEIRRALEQLTREQSELRQKAEELARQMAQSSSQQSKSQQSNGQQSQSQSGGGGQDGQGGKSEKGQSGSQQNANQQGMRDVSEAMRNAANDLRRQDPKQASAAGSKALDKLREMQRQLESAQPDERRRAMGDMQLEARQLADAQRRIASELSKSISQQGQASADAMRRLAGEQERLAERTKKLEGAGGDAGKDLERQRVSDRMQQSADAMRGGRDAQSQSAAQQDLAKALDRAADKLAQGTGGGQDGESRKLSEQLSRTQQLREQLDNLGRQMSEAGQAGQAGRTGQSSQKSAGQQGRTGQGQAGGGGGDGTDLARMRQEAEKKLQETKDLLDQLKRDDPNGQTFAKGGAGFTFEGQGMTLSAPGTEAFKQDFAKWDELRRQATQALDNAESTLSKKLQAKQAKDRLAAGADDKAPSEYQKQVDDYFKAIAKKKQ
ncbi:MAG TPA: DUF4175 family protein [Vicinamibacterales bacterium]|nr:DUF4175 family protein [Vicinamibacterales bacterium]